MILKKWKSKNAQQFFFKKQHKETLSESLNWVLRVEVFTLI